MSFFLFTSASAQKFKADVSYKYMYVKQWDRIIQTYNFSRPFISTKQPLFRHGIHASASHLIASTKKISSGLNVSYSYFRSSAENENLDNILHLHFLNVGYIIHYENAKKIKGIYTDLIFSATASGLFRNVNGAPFVYDEKKSRAFGIGGDISMKVGYDKKSTKKTSRSFFILLGYTPYFYCPNTETVINQTKGQTVNYCNGILNTQIGITFNIKSY